jgi:glycosyltransferase involved in cell wall biosynthesis
MKRLHYIGNKLYNSKSNVTSIEILGALFEKEGYNVSYASSKNNIALRLCDMIISTIKYRKEIDYILIDTYSTLNFYYALVISQIARFLKIPFIPILRGGDMQIRLKTSDNMCKLIFNYAHLCIVPSKFLKESLESYGYENVKYIPNTIEIKNYQFMKRDFIAPKLLWVRSFSKIYNPLMAVKVLRNLEDSGVEATLCMVGPDSDGTLAEIENLAKQLNVDVKITGKLTKQQWIALSEDYNVFINTTNIDNTPISVIEAMALGLPIVSTNVGGIPYLIENEIHGLLVERDNTEAMSKAIRSLFNEPLKREIIISNARKLAESFDWAEARTAWNETLQN